MKRLLKQYTSWMPTIARQWLRAGFATTPRQEAIGAAKRFILEEEGENILCHAEDVSFRVPRQWKGELDLLTRDNEEGVEFHALRNIARVPGILLDVGAHRGLFTAFFLSCNVENKAIAFEPSPVLARDLDALKDLNTFASRLEVEQIAIADHNGKVEMLLDPWGGFVQVKRFQHTMWGTPEKIVLQCEMIDSWVSRTGITPTLIKVDVEGYEWEVLCGAANLLAGSAPVLFVELHLNYLEERGLRPRAVVDFLSEYDYTFTSHVGRFLAPRQIYDHPLGRIHFIAQKTR